MKIPALPSESAPTPGNAYLQLQVRSLILEEGASAGSNYVVLAKIFDKAARGRCPPSSVTYFAYIANVVEHQLACANSELHGTNTLNECLVLALLMNNRSSLWKYGLLSPVVRRHREEVVAVPGLP